MDRTVWVSLLDGCVALWVMHRVYHWWLGARLRRRVSEGIAAGSLPMPCESILALARAGQEVEALRAYRRLTGAGLREARAMIARNRVVRSGRR